jgi:hypothetical protein
METTEVKACGAQTAEAPLKQCAIERREPMQTTRTA